MDLKKLVRQAHKAGGYRMTPSQKKRLFGSDSRLARNTLDICQSATIKKAVTDGIIGDHRVISELRKAGPVATEILLGVETKLGRALPRERAHKLIKAYLSIKAKRTGIERTKRFLESIVINTRSVELA